MARYTFVKDYTYQSCGIACFPKVIKKGSTLYGTEQKDGILISLDPNTTVEDAKKSPYQGMPDMPSILVLVSKDYVDYTPLKFTQIQVGQDNSTTTNNPKIVMKLICNDGTTSYGDFRKIVPCKNNGGVKSMTEIHNEEISFFEKHKNHLLLLGGLVVGYLLYKKYKK